MSANDVLLLIGHGSARYPDAASTLLRHAQQVRNIGDFVQVEVGLLNGAPSVEDALARIGSGVIRVVPFFMEDGYFCRVAIPRALGDRPIIMCPPVGIHDGMAGLLERQALAACDTQGTASRSAAVLVVGHGSSTAPGQALALHRHAARVAATELFARVEAACLEEAPFVAEILHELRSHPVIVIGFFANHGGHVRDDLPALIAAEQTARLSQAEPEVRYHGVVTDDPTMVQILIDQARHGRPAHPRGE